MTNEKIKNQQEEESKIYRGAIVIFYKIINDNPYFLVVQNTGTGNIAFISGAE